MAEGSALACGRDSRQVRPGRRNVGPGREAEATEEEHGQGQEGQPTAAAVNEQQKGSEKQLTFIRTTAAAAQGKAPPSTKRAPQRRKGKALSQQQCALYLHQDRDLLGKHEGRALNRIADRLARGHLAHP